MGISFHSQHPSLLMGPVRTEHLRGYQDPTTGEARPREKVRHELWSPTAPSGPEPPSRKADSPATLRKQQRRAEEGQLDGKNCSPICFYLLAALLAGCQCCVHKPLCQVQVRPWKPSLIRRDPTPLPCKMGRLKWGDFGNSSQLEYPRSWVLAEAEGSLAQVLRFCGTTRKQTYLRRLSWSSPHFWRPAPPPPESRRRRRGQLPFGGPVCLRLLAEDPPSSVPGRDSLQAAWHSRRRV